MKITIKTKNIELTDYLKDFTEKKFFALKKFINILKKEEEKNTLAEVLVELEKETRHHRKGDIFLTKCRIHLPGRVLVACARADDLLKSVVAAKDEMKLEIGRYKFKKTSQRRREQRKMKHDGSI